MPLVANDIVALVLVENECKLLHCVSRILPAALQLVLDNTRTAEMRKDNEDVFKVLYLRLKQVYKFYFQDINFLVPTKPTNEILGTSVCKIHVSAGRFSVKISGIVKIS